MTTLPSLPIHPAANLFPQMGVDEMTALIADIHRQGLITPIVMYRGAILDGRHRYEAIRQLYERGVKIQPCFTEYEGDEPFQFVLSVNLHRRHMTVSQKAVVGLRLKEQFQANGVQRGRPKDGTPAGIRGEARQLAAAAVGVSARVIDYAETVKDKAPDLFEAMRAGEVSVWKAMERIEERENPLPPHVAPVSDDEVLDWDFHIEPPERKIIGKGVAHIPVDWAGIEANRETPPAQASPSPATIPTDPLDDALTAEDEAERTSDLPARTFDPADLFDGVIGGGPLPPPPSRIPETHTYRRLCGLILLYFSEEEKEVLLRGIRRRLGIPPLVGEASAPSCCPHCGRPL